MARWVFLTRETPLPGAQAYLISVGPIAVSVDASSWGYYGGGVLSYAECGSDIDHAVLLVGYGTDSKLGAYWTIKVILEQPPSFSQIKLNPLLDPPSLPTTTTTTTHHPPPPPFVYGVVCPELVGRVVGRGGLHSAVA
jgi:hypothetical protein